MRIRAITKINDLRESIKIPEPKYEITTQIKTGWLKGEEIYSQEIKEKLNGKIPENERVVLATYEQVGGNHTIVYRGKI